MASGRTELDEHVGDQPEDLVRKISPDLGKDDAAADRAEDGGASKLPPPYTPFKLGG